MQVIMKFLTISRYIYMFCSVNLWIYEFEFYLLLHNIENVFWNIVVESFNGFHTLSSLLVKTPMTT